MGQLKEMVVRRWQEIVDVYRQGWQGWQGWQMAEAQMGDGIARNVYTLGISRWKMEGGVSALKRWD